MRTGCANKLTFREISQAHDYMPGGKGSQGRDHSSPSCSEVKDIGLPNSPIPPRQFYNLAWCIKFSIDNYISNIVTVIISLYFVYINY